MTLELRETADGLAARFEYDRDLFEEASVARFARHFEALLRAVTADPELPISRIPLLEEAERAAIVALGTGDFSGPPVARPFHELFEEQVARGPERPALEFGGERLDYRALNGRANRLARRLRAAGVEPGTIVGLCLDRSAELIVALLAILKAGAAFLPLDSTLPSERLRFMLEETGATPVLTRRGEAAALSGIPAKLLLLDGLPPDPAGANDLAASDLGVRVEDGALAYVLYTSGSTGRPKGVMVPQRALANHMLWMRDAGLVTADDRVLQKTPIGFDVALWECFAPLLERRVHRARAAVRAQGRSRARRDDRRARDHRHGLRPLDAALRDRGAALRRVPDAPPHLLSRRVAPARPRPALRGAVDGGTLQPVRADRDDDPLDRLALRCAGGGDRDRPADRADLRATSSKARGSRRRSASRENSASAGRESRSAISGAPN